MKLSPSKLYQSYVSKKLYKLIWKPLETYVRPGDKVYFSPAGLLHTVNMEALQDEAGLCAYQKFSLERLGSTKQLCQGIKRSGKLTKKLLHGAEVVLYGGLNYEVDTLQMSDTCISANSPDLLVWNSRGQLPEIDSVLRIGWEYLPETKTEVEQIRQMLEKKGVQVQEFAARQVPRNRLRIFQARISGFCIWLRMVSFCLCPKRKKKSITGICRGWDS